MRLPNPLGDAVMATPALRALRRGLPDAEIHALGPPQHEPLLAGVEGFDVYHPYRGRSFAALRERARALQDLAFDVAVILPDSPRAALDAVVARIPRRIGYGRDWLRRALLTQSIDAPREHGQRVPFSMIERYLRIPRLLGIPDAGDRLTLVVSEADKDAADAALSAVGVARDDAMLLVSPGAAFGRSKLWPPRHFAQACDEITRRFGLRVVLAPAPNPEEEAIAAQVAQAMQEACVVLPPTDGLGTFKAVVARATLVLTNDTGPRHLAVALDRPVVTLMGPTDPRHTAHHLERQRVLFLDLACRPCHAKECPLGHQRCLVDLPPEQAVEAAAQLLSRQAEAPRQAH